MANRGIKEGDIVNVFFGKASPIHDCVVLHVPGDVGDSWALKERGAIGRLHEVILFERMTKTGEEPKKEGDDDVPF